MFKVSPNALKKLARDSRVFSFAVSGGSTASNALETVFSHHPNNVVLVAMTSAIWFVAFQVLAIIAESVADSQKPLRQRRK